MYNKNKVVLYKFYKDKCAPCYALSKTLASIELPSYFEIVEKNVGIEENKLFAESFGIDKVPALVFAISKNKLVGQHSRKEVEEFILG